MVEFYLWIIGLIGSLHGHTGWKLAGSPGFCQGLGDFCPAKIFLAGQNKGNKINNFFCIIQKIHMKLELVYIK